jgi:glycerol-3-phosphate acyltransferase PlsY
MLVARARGVDITREGSGNIGATNVSRVLGKGAGILVLILDIFKGLIPALVFQMIVQRPIFGIGYPSQEFGLLCGGLAMVGHMSSPFLGFRGGKGIATGLGMLVGSAPVVGFWALITFAAAFAVTRIVSLSSLIAVIAMVVAGFYLTPVLFWVVYGVLAALIFWKHRANIERLLKGEEAKFSFAKTAGSDGPGVGETSGEDPSNREDETGDGHP